MAVFFLMKCIRCIQITMLMIMALCFPALALEFIDVSDSRQVHSLGEYLEIIEDRSGSLTWTDIMNPDKDLKWVKSQAKIPNYGYSKSTYWVRCGISYKTAPDSEQVLHVDYHPMGRIELRMKQGNTVHAACGGLVFGYSGKELKESGYSFKFRPKPGEMIVYMHFSGNNTMQFPVYVSSTDSYYHKKNRSYIISSFLSGILIVMAMYNLFLFISVREMSYLYYIFYILSLVLAKNSFEGLPVFSFMWDHHYVQEHFLTIGVGTTMLFSSLFARSFLLNDRDIFGKYMFRWIIPVNLVSTASGFIFGYNHSIRIVTIAGCVNILGILVVAFRTLCRGNRSARFFIPAWSILMVTMFVWGLRGAGILPANSVTNDGLWYSAALEVTLFSFAFADRINVMRKEKFFAQENALRVEREAVATLETEVKRRTDDLLRANEKLKALDMAKTVFFSNVSHELRTPLTLMLTPINEAIKGTPMGDETLGMMKRNGENLLSIINDLLELSRIDAGRMKLSVCETDMNALLDNFAAEMESTLRLRKITLEYRKAETPIIAYIDVKRFSSVLSNFLSNSIKFTGPGGTVAITLSGTESEVVFNFTDTGYGIPEEKITTIFERFVQADTGDTRRYEGTGIGLSLVREIVELHGGVVLVESRHVDSCPLNHGTTFTVKIPRGRDHLIGRNDVEIADHVHDVFFPFVRGIVPERSFPAVSTMSSDNDKPLVCVVDDNPDMIRLLADILSAEYRVITAYNGNDALELLERNDEIDLVLSDIMMPGMDGIDMLEKIRNNPKFDGLPVLFLTARMEQSTMLRGLSYGAIDYVSKPFSTDELLLRMRNQMEMRGIRNRLAGRVRELMKSLKERVAGAVKLTDENAVRMERVCEFIREHFREDLERETLSETVGIHPDVFSRNFNKHTGQSLIEFINSLRIEEAKRLLKDTDLAIIRIAMDTGFDSVRTFNRVFAGIAGMSPRDFRVGIRG